jgi:DNA/RNA endonuclease G (NUC1)
MNPGKAKHDIQFIKKTEFDIFYSCKYKYPLLVKEQITKLTGTTHPDEPAIDRRTIDDPFREDVEIPAKFRHTLEDYKKYMEYGGSMGHNAPAGQHKTNMDIYYKTFLLSNITPQNMVLNSGLWVVIENWCKILGKHPKINELVVFTGSIPAIKNSRLDNIEMNIPGKMFKIVVMKMSSNPDNIFMEIIITDNKPYYIFQDTNTPLETHSKKQITQDNIVKLNDYVLNRHKWIQFQY